MRKIKILVDSTADLSPEYIKEHDIEIVPLCVNFGEQVFRDGVDITVPDLYKKVNETNALPKTSAITAGELIEIFKKYIDEDYDIFYTGISSKMSCSYQNAILASQEFESGRILIYDSQNLSTGIGLQVLKVVKLRDEGKSLSEINDYLLSIRDKVRAQFLIETMDYLFKGGRCSAISYFFGRGFKIKPIIRVENGSMKVFKKPIGKTLNACNTLLDIVKNDLQNIDLDCIMITSTNAPTSEEYLYKQLSTIVDPSKIMVTHAGCVISSHCGPGTIGILYILK